MSPLHVGLEASVNGQDGPFGLNSSAHMDMER